MLFYRYYLHNVIIYILPWYILYTFLYIILTLYSNMLLYTFLHILYVYSLYNVTIVYFL